VDGERASQSLVYYYTPHNEPLLNIKFCGQIGIWPPYLHGDDGYVKIAKNVCKGIILTVQAIRDVQPESTMVYVDCGRILPKEGETFEEASLRIAKDLIVYDLISGKIDSSHILYGYLLEHGLTEDELNCSMFIKDKMVLTDELMGKGAEMLRDIIRAYYERYNRPVFITETSAGYSDEEKIDWLRRSVEVISDLRNKNVPVIGYRWWPLIDAVQWTYRFDTAPVEEHMRAGGWNNGLYTMKKGFDGIFQKNKTKLVQEYKEIITQGPP